MEGGILVAAEADEADLALLLRLIERLEHAALGVGQLGIVVVDDAVDLPHVQVIGLQPPQRLLEHRKGEPPAPAVRADLGHEDDLVPPTPECPPEQVFRLAVVIFPGVVEEGDAGIHRLVDEADRLVRGGEIAEVVTAHTQGRHLGARTTQRSPGDIAGAGVVGTGVGDAEPHPGTEHSGGAHELPPGGVPPGVGRGAIVPEHLTVTQRPRMTEFSSRVWIPPLTSSPRSGRSAVGSIAPPPLFSGVSLV